MIPALLAAPVVEGVVGGVMGLFSHPSSTVSKSNFAPHLDQATAAAAPSEIGAPRGIMRSTDWSQMSDADVKSWAKGLTGSRANAVETSGRTVSGVVNGAVQMGNVMALNIGGHLVSLSQLQQISWTPSIA